MRQNENFRSAVRSSYDKVKILGRSRNNIDKIVDDEGNVWSSEQYILRCIGNYYMNLFKSSNPPWETIDIALSFVENRVDEDMNAHLDRDFTEEEVTKAVFDINASKAPGPAGFSASFFHKL